ncbi:MAG: DUF2796 domain-containing protein [Thiotrichales bacterium]|nr:DUF2796 domain-containing protein [Thiotrichales bacterium]
MRLLTLLTIGFLTGMPLLAAQSEAHEAHEHGVANLTLAQSGEKLLLSIHSPAYNVFGFEHAPVTEAEKALVKTHLQALSSGKQIDGKLLIRFNAEAQCELKRVDVGNPFHAQDEARKEANEAATHHDDADHDADHDAHHEHHHHADIDADYSFTCQAPLDLSSLDLTGLFMSWQQLEQVRAQWVVNNKQSAATLSRQNTSALLK